MWDARRIRMSLRFGPHFCIGALLARLEMRLLLELLLTRIESIELNGVPKIVSSIQFCGLKALPIRVSLRVASV
jgi:cytochrome P450